MWNTARAVTLAALVAQNMRARKPFGVDDVVGVAGFLLPGNRVDVLSSRIEKRRAVTKTILNNIKVLAVDQKVSPNENEPTVVRAVTPGSDSRPNRGSRQRKGRGLHSIDIAEPSG